MSADSAPGEDRGPQGRIEMVIHSDTDDVYRWEVSHYHDVGTRRSDPFLVVAQGTAMTLPVAMGAARGGYLAYLQERNA